MDREVGEGRGWIMERRSKGANEGREGRRGRGGDEVRKGEVHLEWI